MTLIMIIKNDIELKFINYLWTILKKVLNMKSKLKI